jgi:hypothetical protein
LTRRLSERHARSGQLEQPRRAAWFGREALALLGRVRAVRLLDDGEELVGVELRRVEAGAHDPVRRVVAARDNVEEVANADDVADLKVFDVLDKELGEQANRRAFALERVGERHEGVHEDRAERVQPAELLLVELAEEELPRGVAELGAHRPEGVVERLLRGVVLRPQDALLGDRGEVAVLEVDRVEASLGPLQRVAHERVLKALVIAADHLGEIALTRDETDEGDVAVRLLRLHELHELLHLVVEPGEIGRPRCEPQDELVEEQHHAGVAEGLRVASEDHEALVELHELAALLCESPKAGLHERVEELFAGLRIGRVGRRFESLAGPQVGFTDRPPGVVGLLTGVHRGEELVLAELVEHPARVVEELLVSEDAGEVGFRVALANGVDVAPEDRALDVAGVPDHVKAELEELRLAAEAVLIAQNVELRDPPRVLVAIEEQRKERHEVRLAASEAALQKRGAASTVAECAADQIERLVERADQRWRDHVGLGGDLRLLDRASELLDEADLVDALGEVEQVFDSIGDGRAHRARGGSGG